MIAFSFMAVMFALIVGYLFGRMRQHKDDQINQPMQPQKEESRIDPVDIELNLMQRLTDTLDIKHKSLSMSDMEHRKSSVKIPPRRIK